MMMWAKFQLLNSRAMCWWVIHRRWNLFGRNLTRHKKRFEYDHDDGFDLMIKISTIKLTAIKLIWAYSRVIAMWSWLLNVPPTFDKSLIVINGDEIIIIPIIILSSLSMAMNYHYLWKSHIITAGPSHAPFIIINDHAKSFGATESWPFFPNHSHFFTYFNLSSIFQLLPLFRSYKEGGKQKEDRRLSLYYTHKITPDRFCPDLSVFGWVSLRDSLSQMRRRRRTKLTMPALSWVLAVQGFICLAFTIVAIVASQPG